MMMWFETGKETVILFESWSTTTTTQYALSCIAIMFFGIAHHLTITLRALHNANTRIARRLLGKVKGGLLENRAGASVQEDAGGACEHCAEVEEVPPFLFCMPADLYRAPYVAEALDALFYGIALTLAYFNMLIAMTYNVGLFISVVVGEMIGHFIFNGVLKGSESNATKGTSCHDA